MTDYTPIACALHDEYELAIMRRRRLTLAWHDEAGNARTASLLPTDLQTRNGAEFLLAQDADGNTLRIRLDRIIRHR